MIEATKETTGEFPQQVLADTGYRSEANFERAETMKVEVIVALGREGKAETPEVMPTNTATLRMKDKLATAEGKAAYRRRKAIVEPVFGWVKRVVGFQQFSLRGLTNVTGEWSLVCLATNLRRMSAWA
jgi:hypothetical protein